MTFSERLSALCASSKELANYLGCSVQAVNQYKNGTAFPKTENLIKIAEYFGVSLDYLVGFSNSKSRDLNAERMRSQILMLSDSLNDVATELSETTEKIKNAVEYLRSLS